jgi:hypothetical protein
MIRLESYESLIVNFIQEKTEEFEKEHGKPSTIGIYCCPWAGWLTVNYNTKGSLGSSILNCPDFEYVEYDMLELDEWSEEYVSDEPKFSNLDKNLITIDREQGDEIFNEIMFKYLNELIIRSNLKEKSRIFLQMLDSKYKGEVK